jgi:hypothetical protein
MLSQALDRTDTNIAFSPSHTTEPTLPNNLFFSFESHPATLLDSAYWHDGEVDIGAYNVPDAYSSVSDFKSYHQDDHMYTPRGSSQASTNFVQVPE